MAVDCMRSNMKQLRNARESYGYRGTTFVGHCVWQLCECPGSSAAFFVIWRHLVNNISIYGGGVLSGRGFVREGVLSERGFCPGGGFVRIKYS